MRPQDRYTEPTTDLEIYLVEIIGAIDAYLAKRVLNMTEYNELRAKVSQAVKRTSKYPRG